MFVVAVVMTLGRDDIFVVAAVMTVGRDDVFRRGCRDICRA
jgi:hypothetical protein